ncbi:hypothetical protein PBRA_000613 [Plasmodiophora brassicae]|nr:hypothetical protein PBRA_000613 [Plasmodiophora brassicae]
MVFSSAAVFTTPDSEVPAIPFQYAAGAVAVYPVRLQEATFDVRVPLSASDRQPLHPRYQTRFACVYCHHHKLGCNYQRPCERCVRAGLADQCVDRPHSCKRGSRQRVLSE